MGPSGGATERGLGRALLGGGPAQGKKKGCIWGLQRAEPGWTQHCLWGRHWRFPGGLLVPFGAVLESLIWGSKVGWDFLKRWNGQHSLNGNDFIQFELLL